MSFFSSSRIPRGLLRQMAALHRSRSDPYDPERPEERECPVFRQRCHIEWLCDYNPEAFRDYVHCDIPNAHITSPGRLTSSVTWRRQTRHVDTLYHGTGRPVVLFMPAGVGEISFREEGNGLNHLSLELYPLVQQDIVGLHLLVNFVQSGDYTFPRLVHTSTLLAEDDTRFLDETRGAPYFDGDWNGVHLDDYLLAELQVSRIFTPDHTWAIRYSLLTVTRLATNS